MRRILYTKLERLSYVIIALWMILGSVCVCYGKDFKDLSVYFLSLTGFATTYVFGETKRPSEATALFIKGPSSSREKMMYWVMVIWFFLGLVGLVKGLSLPQMGAYFASLTPFVSAYIIGNTLNPEKTVLSKTTATANDSESNPVGDSAKGPSDNN